MITIKEEIDLSSMICISNTCINVKQLREWLSKFSDNTEVYIDTVVKEPMASNQKSNPVPLHFCIEYEDSKLILSSLPDPIS